MPTLLLFTNDFFPQVQYKGQTIKMVLRINAKLFGSEFTIERHKEDGSIETTSATEQCYLVGETESLHTSVAISDCDGLVRSFCRTHAVVAFPLFEEPLSRVTVKSIIFYRLTNGNGINVFIYHAYLNSSVG